MTVQRRHFQRQIRGTLQSERTQVIGFWDEGQIKITTWSASGNGKKNKIEKFVGTVVEMGFILERITETHLQDGWELVYSHQQGSSSDDTEYIQVGIKADVELTPDIDEIVKHLDCVDWCIEEDGVFLIGSETIRLSRSRRKRGEDRPPRLDTITANVSVNSEAAAVLAALAERHGSKMYDDKANLISPSIFYSLANLEGFDDVLSAFGLKRSPRLTGVFVRSTGDICVPSVF